MTLHLYSHFPLILVPVTFTILRFRFVFLSQFAESLCGFLEVISFNDKIRCPGMLRHVCWPLVSGQLTCPILEGQVVGGRIAS
jgi:hypothetical protein